MSELRPPGPRRWYRSLYWRIAIGFIAFLAATLVAQGGLFLWLSTQREETLPPRLLGDLASLVAEELGEAAERGPGVDLAPLADERFRDLGRPAALVLADGRVVAGDFQPPPPLVDDVRAQLAAGDAAWPAGRQANTRRRDLRQQERDSDGRGARGQGRQGPRPLGPPWAVAPVRVNDHVVAAVMVARGRPPAAVARELAPWLAVGLAVLLVAGTALASLAVFRPAQARLRDLEDAAGRFGAGDLTARALERGGDEVASVARAFNRMADEAAAREAALVEADIVRWVVSVVRRRRRRVLSRIEGEDLAGVEEEAVMDEFLAVLQRVREIDFMRGVAWNEGSRASALSAGLGLSLIHISEPTRPY